MVRWQIIRQWIIEFICMCHKAAFVQRNEMNLNTCVRHLCVQHLKHPRSSTSHQCRGMDHPIPQNSQQQFMIHWVGTGKDDRDSWDRESLSTSTSPGRCTKEKERKRMYAFSYPSSTNDAFRLFRGACDNDRVVMTSSRKPTSNLRSSSCGQIRNNLCFKCKKNLG